MIILLMLVFNGLILFWILNAVLQLFWGPASFYVFLSGVISFCVMVGLAFLFTLPVGQWVLRWLCGARRAILREHRQLDPIVDRVQQAIETTCGFKPKVLQLLVLDDPVPSAMFSILPTLESEPVKYWKAMADVAFPLVFRREARR